MDNLEALLIIDEKANGSWSRFLQAYQHIVDSGYVWGLADRYTKAAQALIDVGWLTAPPNYKSLAKHSS